MHEAAGVVKIVWVPPEYGDAVACVCADGTLSLWEEAAEGIFLEFVIFSNPASTIINFKLNQSNLVYGILTNCFLIFFYRALYLMKN